MKIESEVKQLDLGIKFELRFTNREKQFTIWKMFHPEYLSDENITERLIDEMFWELRKKVNSDYIKRESV